MGMLRRAKQMAGRKCEHERRAGKYKPRGRAGGGGSAPQAHRRHVSAARPAAKSPLTGSVPCAASGAHPGREYQAGWLAGAAGVRR